MNGLRSLPRRPLAFVTTAYILGVAFCYLYAPPFLPLLFGAGGSALLWIFCVAAAPDRRAGGYKPPLQFSDRSVAPAFAAALLLVFFLAALYAHAAFVQADPLEAAMTDGTGASPELTGRVLTMHEKKDDYRVLTVLSGGRLLLVRVQGAAGDYPVAAPTDLVGQAIVFRGALSYPDTARNPGGFDYRLHLLSRGIRVIVTAKAHGIAVAPAARRGRTAADVLWEGYRRLCRAKYAFLARISAVLPPEQAALLRGMMFGDKDGIEGETYAMFQRNGVAHILAVSGLHVGIVYGFVSFLLGRRRTRGYYAAVLACLIVYAMLSEFSPSVTRAVAMIGVHIFSKLLNRRYDMLTGVCGAALLLLLKNPLALFGLGFQLSFLAVASLAFALPFCARFAGFRDRLTGRRLHAYEVAHLRGIPTADRLRADVLAFLLPLVCIQLFVIPVTAYRFHYVSLAALPLNILVIALSSFAVPFGLVMAGVHAAAALAPPSLSAAAGFAAGAGTSSCGLLSSLMLKLVRFTDGIPHASEPVGAPPLFAVLLFYGIAWFLMSDAFYFLKRDAFAMRQGCAALAGGASPAPTIGCAPIASPRRIAVCILSVIAVSALLAAAAPPCRVDHAAFTFVDVGQGDCLHIRTPDGRNYLMDGGGREDYDVGKEILAPYLRANGVNHIDGVFASHLHTDHFKGLVELAREMRVDAFYVFDGSVPYAQDALPDQNIIPLAAGATVRLGTSGATAETLFPPAGAPHDAEDENRSSLIVRFRVGGASALMTGDVGFEGEDALLAAGADPAADVLKVGHHGSKYSTSPAFLAAVRPAAAVIQVGKNNGYGHPTPETLATLAGRGIIPYRNDLDGAVMVDPLAGGLRIRTAGRDFTSPMLWKDFERERFERLSGNGAGSEERVH